MKKRLLALLLALVMALGMLPTAFALDADEPAGAISAGAADAETLAEGETEEEAAEPEQPEAEEPAEEPEQAGEEPAAEPEEAEEPAEEPEEAAEVATFAADTDEACAFLEGVRLENGYYTTSSTSSPYIDMSTWSATKPEGYDNYIYYENGTLTIVGEIEATVYTHEVDSSIKATLAVFSGKLTVVGDGRISLRGETIPALLVAYNAAIDFNMTPNDLKDHLIDEQIWIYSWDAMAVWGDVTISNAAKVLIETKHGYGTVLEESYNTISGNAVINGGHVTLSNETNGACVKGNLNVTADGLTIRSQENDVATLTGGNYDIATDSMSIENRCGAAVDGNIKFSEMSGHASIYGCAGDGVPLVNGNMELVNASVTMVNKNRWVPGSYDETYKVAEGCKDDGPVLVGNLTAKNKEIDYAYIELSRPSESDEPVIIGDIDLTNTLGYLRTNDGGMAMKGNKITLTDSDLGIWDYESHLEESPELVIEGCNLLMKNSSINVSERKSAWNSIEILDDYQWYAGSLDRPEVEDFKSSSKGSLNPKLVNNQRTLVINSGDKCEEPRSAEYPSNPSLDGVVGQFMQTVVAVELTGDTLELQKVPGYGYLYSSYENGEEVKHYGLPASTDLSKYLTINTPAGGVWTVTTSGRTYQGDTELPLYIIGTATTTCEDVPLEMTISGDILASGEALTVTEKNTVCWNIRASAAGVDFDNIRTAYEFAKAVGGEDYATVTGNTVTLQKGALMEKSITMTGEFTVDLNGYELYYSNAKDPVLRSGAGKQTIRGGSANGAVNYVHNSIIVTGGELTLEGVKASFVTVEDGTLHMNETAASAVDVTGGVAEVSGSTLNFAGIKDGELILRETEIKKNSATSLRVNGGKVSIKDGTQIPCIVLVTGGEVQIDGGTFSGYEGHWLQQTGGLVSVNNGNLTGTMLVMDGELDLHGGEYSSGEAGNLGLYQAGGKVTAENVHLTSTAMKEEAEDGEIYYNHRCIWLDGGELTLKNTVVTGAVFINDGAKLEMTDSSIMTVNAVALYLDNSAAMITNGKLQGQNLAVNLGGKNASVTLNGGDLSGDIWGVLVGGGSFTMLDGTINGGKTGILVTGPKCKLTVTGGEVASPEVALYVENGSTVQLSGGTFTGDKNAIFAENGTMKGWLASGCEMSGDGLPDLFDPASESETGPGTVRIVEADYVGKAEKANEIMAKLPTDSSKIEKGDLALIEAAEEAYDAASADKNVKKLLDKALVKRVKAARKAYDKNEKAANKVQAMIDDLPDVSELEYAKHRKAVDKADKAFNKLTAAQRTFLTQDDVDTGAIGAETKLNACIKRIRTLENYEQTIKTAQTAFKKIPEWSKLKKSDESKVEAARKALDALLEQEKTAGGFIIPETDANRQKCEASIKAYDAFKKIAAEYRETYLNDLPSGNNVSKDSAGKINAAREAYDNLGKTEYPGATKNIQSFIDKKELTKLKNLEKQLAKNEKAALKVTKLIEKLLDYNTPFDSKQAKAIDAAWKAYEKLGSDAVKSFVENVETLTELYYQLHPDLRPGVWSVIDCAYISFPKGEAVLNADVVDFEAKTTTSAVKKLSSTDLNEYYDDTDISIDASLDAAAAKNFAYELATALKNLPNSEYSKDFNSLYDHLLKIAADKDGALSVKVGRYSNGAALNWAFGIHPYQLAQAKAEGKTVNLDDYTIKVVNGKPYLEITDDGQYSNASITPDKNDKDIALSSKTRFLVHNMDGTYSAYTGYKNVPSLIAHYAEVVFDADYTNELVAEVVYLTV